MNKFSIKKQISTLYASTVLGRLSLTGAWVAILAARGYSLAEIGFAETVFHAASLIFEIPSGVLADVFGRKKMLIMSSLMTLTGNLIMIFSFNFPMICLAFVFHAMGYNFESGSGDALAYDSMKSVGVEEKYDRFASNQFVIYRICNGLSTMCAGLALHIGYRLAYSTDIVIGIFQLLMLSSLVEVTIEETKTKEEAISGLQMIKDELKKCVIESVAFLRTSKSALLIMLCNSLVGAGDILLLFFLQDKLLLADMPKWALGFALLFMELGGVLGAKIILLFKNMRYRLVFFITGALVVSAILVEHTGILWLMTLGGFVAAMSDDALQLRSTTMLQQLIPSEQRATLISVDSFMFSMIMIVLSPIAGLFFTVW
ncbi:MAG: MFS transporter [Lachnospiraceae bacterium]|nr:MFS transporter [Lachnospiraceae bacterium]